MSDLRNEDAQKLVDGLCSDQKLLRDRGLGQLKAALPGLSFAAVNDVVAICFGIIEDNQSPWESKHGALEGLTAILSARLLGEGSQALEHAYWPRIRNASLNLLVDNEVRVRQSAGCVLGAMCACDFGQTYATCYERVLELVKSNLERQMTEVEFGEVEIEESSGPPSIEFLQRKLSNSTSRERRLSGSRDAKQIFHDTAGWRNLESSLNALENMIKGTGEHFSPYCTEKLVSLIMETLTHPNRFVRETGFGVCSALVTSGFVNELSSNSPATEHGPVLVQHLGLGLADNWSQVRMAASVASRKFLTSLPVAARHFCYPVLLPRICLNRYYVAEGVRLYSQETWRQVTGSEGKALVQQYMEHVVRYYIEATTADNHAVREAACACIAELATKLPGESVREHVPALLAALLACFTDDSWPVRDAACVACGHFIQSFPKEAQPAMEGLYPLFFNNLQDSIPSVRQGAAVALGNVVQAYGSCAINIISPLITERLQAVSTQPSESEKYSDLEKGPATYGVVKKRRDNDIELHEDKQMYSCGSLAPKMGRGGCSDCRFKRPPQPWEASDGAIWLLGELAMVGGHEGQLTVQNTLELLAESCRLKHFTQHVVLLETLCKNLPRICKGLGKKIFKPKFHLFIDHIFYALECEQSLTSSAASQCLTALSADLGPNILRSRIEQHNPNYLSALDANSYIAPL